MERYERLKRIVNKCLRLVHTTDIEQHLSQSNLVPDELDKFIIKRILEQEEENGRSLSSDDL